MNGRYRLVLRLQAARGLPAERVIEDESCDAVTNAAALLIALALERDEGAEQATATASEPRPTDRVETGVTTNGAAKPGDSDAPAQLSSAAERAASGALQHGAPRTRARETPASAATIVLPPDNAVLERPGKPIAVALGAGAALGFDAGMLPRAPAFAPQLRLQLQVDQLRVLAGVALWLGRRGSSERYATAQIDGGGVVGGVSLGVDLVRSPLVFGPALLLELGRLTVETHGISAPQASSVTWLGAGGGVHFGYPFGAGFEASLDLGALLPFARPRWLLRTRAGAVELFTTAPAVLRVSTGFGYVFQ